MERSPNSALLPSLIAGLALLGGVIGYQIGSPGRDAEPAPVTSPPPSAPAAQAIDWSQVSERDLNIAALFVTARDQGPARALEELRELAAEDSSVWRRGHSIAHTIGRYIIRERNHDPAVLDSCLPLFQAGCYHGVMEGYMAAVPDVQPPALTELCAKLDVPGSAEISPRECAHGLGHGLLERLGYDIPRALGACDTFAAEALRGECHDGVFMQNVVRGRGLPSSSTTDLATADAEHAAGGHQHGGAATSEMAMLMAGESFRADDLAFPCNHVDARYQPACWSYQPVAIGRFKGDRGLPTLSGCELAPHESMARCYAGYGKQSTVWTTLDESRMIESCALAPAPHDMDCLAGVVEALVDRSWGPEMALSFCRRVAGERAASAEGCYQSMGTRIVLLYADPRETEQACASSPEPRLIEACRRGASMR
jgi:hypothetical protein